ncbi:MAG: hypothetical protein ACFFCT_14455 [Candidatus Odinarchaeota archaeon]
MSVAEQVSHLTFLRRLRKLAEMALASYELEEADLKFINYSGNGLYRVSIPKERFIAPNNLEPPVGDRDCFPNKGSPRVLEEAC